MPITNDDLGMALGRAVRNFTRVCPNCGLLSTEPDLAGCTRDTVSEHVFVGWGERPYASWEWSEIVARRRRALLKARSSKATADHFRVCPEAGPGQYVTELYEQKTAKRTRLAALLWRELQNRVDEGDEHTLPPYDLPPRNGTTVKGVPIVEPEPER